MEHLEFDHGNVKTTCHHCGVRTSFEHIVGGQRLGYVVGAPYRIPGEKNRFAVVFQLVRCATCGQCALAEIHHVSDGDYRDGFLKDFSPAAPPRLALPNALPAGIVSEFREAENCMSILATRAASALFRSTLEKALLDSGYDAGSLYSRIEAAATDGLITDARKQRAHDEIRVLGNDVVHDPWKKVPIEDVEAAHHYTQRILEDLYDDRPRVVATLKQKGRKPTGSP